MSMRRVVVVGAGLAGVRAAESLRVHGFSGSVTLVGDEPHHPYSRPPLSKGLLGGEETAESCAIATGLQADWLLGDAATGLDLDERSVTLASSRRVPFDGLVIATGCRARAWPGGPGLAGLYTLRTIDDAIALRAAASSSARAVIVGAGFVGCEVAATLRRLGLDVDVVDTAPHPLAPLGADCGQRVAEMHTRRGVRFHLGTSVVAFAGVDHVEAVELSDGAYLETGFAVIALGATPNTEWLSGSGLELEAGGVLCDSHCLAVGTGNVVAAGDAATWHHQFLGETLRVEHWNNAAEMAFAATGNLLADPPARSAYNPVPSFWSDQYGTRIQSVGFLGHADRITLVSETGLRNGEARSAVYEAHRGDELVGAIALNDTKQILRYRRMLNERIHAASP